MHSLKLLISSRNRGGTDRKIQEQNKILKHIFVSAISTNNKSSRMIVESASQNNNIIKGYRLNWFNFIIEYISLSLEYV